MAITDRINSGLERLSTSPLGMAGLGLLMQPSMSREPINPFQYAIRGMQAGIQNKAAQEQSAATQEQVALRRAEYLRNILRYNQEGQAIADAAAEKERQNAAFSDFMASLPPEEQRMAAVMGPEYAKQMMMNRNQTGRLPAANIQEYEAAKQGGFTGSFMDYMNSKMTRPVSPNYQAIPTAEGMQSFDTRTGRIKPIQGLPPAQYDPALQEELAASKAAGTMEGEQRTAARLDLLAYLDSSQAMISKVAELIKHPGMRAAVGAPSPSKAMMYVPGTDAANFMARLREVQGGQFLEAFKTLKGGGAITQTEGEKATQAISRMSTSQDEQEFVTAANEFIAVVRKGIERAQSRASGGPSVPSPVVPSAPSGDVNFEDLPE